MKLSVTSYEDDCLKIEKSQEYGIMIKVKGYGVEQSLALYRQLCKEVSEIDMDCE